MDKKNKLNKFKMSVAIYATALGYVILGVYPNYQRVNYHNHIDNAEQNE